MKIGLVSWMLLLIGVSLCSGHYIRQTEDKPDVYSVQDGSSKIAFMNPKPKGPTLREILYYHVIERKPEDNPETPITERSFTNSHGYQFLEKHPSSDEEQYDDGEHEDEEHYHEEPNEEANEELEQEENEIDGELHGDGGEEADNDDEEEPESTTTQKPLTDADVKNAYKARSYLFDQMRQRYAVKRMAEPIHRRKRQAEIQDLKSLPKTYGMSLNPDGGYVWNNLNQPNSYYELQPPSGSPSEGQDTSAQSQENIRPSYNENGDSENSQTTNENTNYSDEDSDICVGINKPCALLLQTNENPNHEDNNKNFEINDSDNESTADVSNDDSESDDGMPNYPSRSVAFENPELSSAEPNSEVEDANYHPKAPLTYGMSLTSGGRHVWNDLINPSESYAIGSSNEDPAPNNSEPNYPVKLIPAGNESDMQPDSGNAETIVGDKEEDSEILQNSGIESVEENANAGSSNEESKQEEFGPASVPEVSYEQLDNTYVNPQQPEGPQPMEDILATMQPPEDIPKTYGMNLTSGNGHVWNTLVDPPVSYNIGSDNESPEPRPIPEPNTSDENEPADPVTINEEPELINPIPDEPINTEDTYSESNEADKGSNDSEIDENEKEAVPDESLIRDDKPDDTESIEVDKVSEADNPEITPIDPGAIYNPLEIYEIVTGNEHSESDDDNSEHKESEDSNEGLPDVGSEPEQPGYTAGDGWEEQTPEQPWNVPEAPTLPPLNYDNLPDYIRDTISPTEKPENKEEASEEIVQPESHEEAIPEQPAYPEKTEEPIANLEPAPESPIPEDEDQPNEEPAATEEKPEETEEIEHVENSEEPAYPEKEETEEPSANLEPAPESPIPEDEDQPNEEPAATKEKPEVTEEIKHVENPEEPAYPEKEETEEAISNPEPEPPVQESEKPNEEQAEPVEDKPELTEEVKNPEQGDIHEQAPSEKSQDKLDEQKNDAAEVKPAEETAKPDIMDELLRSDQFWKWLGLWTSTYMELLEKHIRKIAREEICNHQRTGDQMCSPNNYEAGNVSNDVVKTDDLGAELKRGHNSQNNHNKGDSNKIEASTIYGNSVGNEKVTNVFIFTADKADEVIDKLKPANDKDIDVIIDERIKEQENKDKESEHNKEPNKVEENYEDINKEDINGELPYDGEANLEEADSSESDKEADKKEPLENEANIENEEEEEQSNESEPNYDILNTEEVTEGVSKEDEKNEEDLFNKEENKEDFNGDEGKNEGDALEDDSTKEIGSNKGETDEKVLDPEEVKKEESSESEVVANEDELNKYEENKEGSNEENANDEGLNKEESNTEELSESGANKGNDERELVSDENKEESSEAEVKEIKEDQANKGSNEYEENLKPETKYEIENYEEEKN